MRIIAKIFIFILVLSCLGCEKTSKNAVELSVDFS